MALGTPPEWGARHICLSFAFWLGVARAVAPTQQVSNLRFEDTNNDGGWLSGDIRWDPPENVDGIQTYGVLILNEMLDITPLPALPGDEDGAWYLCDLGNMPHAPVGTNELTITTVGFETANFPRRGSEEVQPQTRRRYSWGHVHPPDRYLAVTCLNEQKEGGPSVVIPIYDKSDHLPLAHIETISFTDTNDVLGVLDGTIAWSNGIEGDFTLTQTYKVFLASDESGTDEAVIGETTVPEFQLALSGVERDHRDFIRIRGVNPNGISSWSHSSRLYDSGPSPPLDHVTALSFTDTDYTHFHRYGYVAGSVTWTPPDDEAPISSYRIFLSDQQGVGGELVPADGYVVPVGTNHFSLPTQTLRSEQDYLHVYAENDKGMQSTPTELAIVDISGS